MIFTLLFSACDKDDNGPSEQDIQRDKLIGTWVVDQDAQVTRNDVVLTEWNNFELIIYDQTYTTLNGIAPTWPPSGTWQFVGDSTTEIEREDGTVIKIKLTDNALQLTFSYDDPSTTGRLKGTDGDYIFNMIRK